MELALPKKNKAYIDSNHNRRLTPTASMENLAAEYKRIILEYNAEINVTLFIKKSDLSKLSCEWLLEEAKREFKEIAAKKQVKIDVSTIVALRTKLGNHLIDYCLTLPEKTLAMLQDGVMLVPYFNKHPKGSQPQKNEGDIPQAQLKDFEFLAFLGKGGFGRVYLARKKENGKYYAIKKIEKSDDPEKLEDERKEIEREKHNFKQIKFPNFVHLHYAFETKRNYYFVEDFVVGGDLHCLLRNQVVFTEAQAKFYIVEILIGINALHSHKFIHRDLKPHNLLLDLDGHIHFADFGLMKSVKSRHEFHYTFCGTLEYMAPEVMTGHGYNYLADYYSLGVLAYEMLIGVPPFQKGQDEFKEEFLQKVIMKRPKIPSNLSAECRSFVLGLLDKDPTHRLGAKKGIKELTGHPWLAGMDFEAIVSRKAVPPLKVDIKKLSITQIRKKPLDLEDDDEIELCLLRSKQFNPEAKPINTLIDLDAAEKEVCKEPECKSEKGRRRKVKLWQKARKKLNCAARFVKARLLASKGNLIKQLQSQNGGGAGVALPLPRGGKKGTMPKGAIFGVEYGQKSKEGDVDEGDVTDMIADDSTNINAKMNVYKHLEMHHSEDVDWKSCK